MSHPYVAADRQGAIVGIGPLSEGFRWKESIGGKSRRRILGGDGSDRVVDGGVTSDAGAWIESAWGNITGTDGVKADIDAVEFAVNLPDGVRINRAPFEAQDGFADEIAHARVAGGAVQGQSGSGKARQPAFLTRKGGGHGGFWVSLL